MSKNKNRRPALPLGTGIGVGPGAKATLPDIRPIAFRPPGAEPDTTAYRMGRCTIFVSRSHFGWHLSIAHPHRYPTWDEICKARYELCPPDITMALLLPPPGQYLNVHENCFHLWEVRTTEPIASTAGV